MKREIFPKVWIADMEGCDCARPCTPDKSGVRIHAAKHPCHFDKVGQLQAKDSRYLGFEEGGDLFLNLIDSKQPLFQKASFDYFLRFAEVQWLAGAPLIIHCNKGLSRSPTLALLFLAKCLRVIPNTCYDDAWDEFLKLCPEYQPGDGIEQWMRSNWHHITERPLPFISGASTARFKFEHYQKPDTTGISPEEAVALVMGSPIVHFSTMVTIEDKNHDLVVPKPNILQMRLDEVYTLFQLRGLTARIIITKPRQCGCSTAVGHLCYHHSRRYRVDGMLMADEGSRTAKIWQLFTDYAKRDTFPWDSQFISDTKKGKFLYPDQTEGQWEQDTAGDSKAGIGGTRHVLWFSESARYSKVGQRTDVKVISESLSSLAKVPKSLAVLESTPEGASGYHYDTWQGAVSIEDFRKGKHGNGWVKIFCAWFEFEEHSIERTSDNEQYFKEELTTREQRGVALYGWDAGQIAWRRKTMITDLHGDDRLFDQNYPEDEVSCFLMTGSPRFSDDGMTRLEIMAKARHDSAERGVLEDTGNGKVEFMKRSDDAWLWMIERPIFGCSYIGSLDPCYASQSKGARDPDAHAAVIIRAAYIDENNLYHPAELVACIDVPGGCRWDATLLAQRMTMMANYYGGCMIVPETGNNDGIIMKLQEYGANIYVRQKFDSIIPGKTMQVVGWETSSSTRNIWVEAMADAIREQEKGFDCCYLPAVKEMRTFIIDDRGKACAASGKHDDFVAAIGIALACIRSAGVYYPPTYREHRASEDRKSLAFSY